MRRRLFNIAAALSLVLCVATVALWVRSYFLGDRFFHARFVEDGRTYFIQWSARTGRGGVGANRHVGWDDGVADYRDEIQRTMKLHGIPYSYRETAEPQYPHFNMGVGDNARMGGFKFGRLNIIRTGAQSLNSIQAVIPFWSIFIASSLLPAIWLRRRRARRRSDAAGLCPSCGYDLRATPGRCPECGAVPTNGVSTAE